MQKRGLGKGLQALLPEAEAESGREEGVREIEVALVKPNPFQPRKAFDGEKLEELAESIREHGVVQPIVVRVKGEGYEIVAGERRWRASRLAGLKAIPAVVREFSETQVMEIALIENLQREDLNPLEEAEGYQRLMDEFRHTQDVLAHRLGKSRSHVANMLRLLKLPPRVRKYLQDGQLSIGHARALIGVENPEPLADAIVRKSLSVRQTEALVKGADDKKARASQKRKPKNYVPRDVDVMALEERMTALLGLKVAIDGEGTEGVLRIEYKSLDQLDDLIERLTQLPVTKY